MQSEHKNTKAIAMPLEANATVAIEVLYCNKGTFLFTEVKYAGRRL